MRADEPQCNTGSLSKPHDCCDDSMSCVIQSRMLKVSFVSWGLQYSSGCATGVQVREVAMLPSRAHACQVHLRERGLGCSRLAGLGCGICSAGSMLGAERGVCHRFGTDSGVCAGLL